MARWYRGDGRVLRFAGPPARAMTLRWPGRRRAGRPNAEVDSIEAEPGVGPAWPIVNKTPLRVMGKTPEIRLV
jgi:hypothetical protein